MLRIHMAACLVATALAATPALAQSMSPKADGASSNVPAPAMDANGNAANPIMGTGPNATTTTTTAPSPGPGSASTAATGTGGTATGGFVAQQQPGQWLASKLIGTNVVGPNNESIGDVNDVLLDRNGRIAAVVVGVGGFLGIGEKTVAVPFDALRFASRDVNATASTAGTGSAGSGTSTGNPDRVVLPMTKQQLQAAPSFKTAAGTASGSSGATTNNGTAAVPAAPTTGAGGAPANGTGGTTAPK